MPITSRYLYAVGKNGCTKGYKGSTMMQAPELVKGKSRDEMMLISSF